MSDIRTILNFLDFFITCVYRICLVLKVYFDYWEIRCDDDGIIIHCANCYHLGLVSAVMFFLVLPILIVVYLFCY